jgi:DNA-binding IclR family transcriptional regulator
MRAHVDSTGEAVHISVLDGLDVVTIDQVDSTQVLRIHWSTGARSRAYAAASGKAMLTVMPADERNRHLPAELDGITTHTITSRDAFDRELDEIAARGYALQRGELCDASPLSPRRSLLARATPVAAISVFMPAHRFPEGGDARLGALVAEATAKISAGLAIRK